MLRHAICGVVLGILLVLAGPLASQSDGDCPNTLPSQLVIGQQGRVTPGEANNLRAEPSASAAQVGSIPGGATFMVIGPAVCAEGFTWANVQYEDTVGYTVEANSNDYFALPVPPADAPLPTAPPAAVAGCPPTQLTRGVLGVTTSNVPSRLRDQPTTEGAEVGFVQPNDTFFVQDGPVCDGTYNWWRVEVDGQGGWLAEGTADDYFVEPLSATATATASITPLPTQTPRPTITPTPSITPTPTITPTPPPVRVGTTYALAWSADGAMLAVADATRGILLYDTNNLNLPARLIAAGPGIVDMALHPNGERVAFARETDTAPYYRRSYEVQVWDIVADEPVYTLTSAADLVPVVVAYDQNPPDDGHNRELTVNVRLSGQVAWSGDGAYLLVGSTLGAWVFEADTPNWVVRTEPPFVGGGWKMLTGDVTDVAFSPDSETFAIAFNSEVYLYEIDTVQREHGGVAPPFGYTQQVGRERRFLVATQDAVAEDLNYRVQVLNFSPNGERLALGDDLGNVQVFNLATGERRMRIRDFDLENLDLSEVDVWGVWDVVFSPDNAHLAAAEGGGSIVNPQPRSSRSILSKFAAVGLTLVNAATLDVGELRSVAYSPDGAWVAVGGTGGVVVLDATTLEPTAALVVSRWDTP